MTQSGQNLCSFHCPCHYCPQKCIQWSSFLISIMFDLLPKLTTLCFCDQDLDKTELNRGNVESNAFIHIYLSLFESPCKENPWPRTTDSFTHPLKFLIQRWIKSWRSFVAKLEPHQSPTARNWVQRVAALHLKLESGVRALCNTRLAKCLKLKRSGDEDAWRKNTTKNEQAKAGESVWELSRWSLSSV